MMRCLVFLVAAVLTVSTVNGWLWGRRSNTQPTQPRPQPPPQPPQPANPCDSVNIVSRSSWNAERPKSTSGMTTPVNLVFIHHTEGQECSSMARCKTLVKNIQYYHMYRRIYDDPPKKENFDDIGYNFLIGGDGNVYEGRGWSREGAHTKNYNKRSIAISFIGNYMNKLPGSRALTVAKKLIQCGVHKGKIRSSFSLYGHRQARGSDTKCPGNWLYSNIRSWSGYKTGTPT